MVSIYNIYDIEKVDNLRKENNLGDLRLNITTIWSGDELMMQDNTTSGYKEEDLQYLRENWSEQIMGKSKWDFPDCYWVQNGLYTVVEGNVKMCCMNTGVEPFGNLFLNTIDEIERWKIIKMLKKVVKQIIQHHIVKLVLIKK